MQEYLDILTRILKKGRWKENRTGMDTLSISGAMFEYEVGETLPVLTTKKMGVKNIAKELDFFVQGRQDKQWLQEVGCHIWDDWCNPQKVPYGNDTESKARMAAEMDLGRIYGVQWRTWRGVKVDAEGNLRLVIVDQLKNALETLRKDPFSRRVIVSAWNPVDMDEMALPPCHYGFQLLFNGESLDLLWNQRSVDTPLGLPYNITSYGLLLRLFAETLGMKVGKLIGFLADVHIYRNQLDGVEEQLVRAPLAQPKLILPTDFRGLLDWDYTQFSIEGYKSYPAVAYPISV
jgi:thymidylate synthase